MGKEKLSCYKVIKAGFYGLFSVGVLLSLVVGGSWYWWKNAIEPVTVNSQSSVTVKIPPGTAAQTVGQKLEKKGLIRSSLAWRVWLYTLKLQEQPDNLQAGTYRLSPTDSLAEIGTKIIEGEVITTRFTIPEGWTQKQMAGYFQELGYFSATEFIQATRN